MNKTLNDLTLMTYAEKTAQKFGITLPEIKLLLKYINEATPRTIRIDNGEFQMWIDKYYIAYSRYDQEEVHYVYLTKTHIREERVSYRKARKERKNQVCLPNTIKSNFIKALCCMRQTKLGYYLDKDFFEIG